jgi:Na+/melibiose symporter-like transporter
MEDRRKLTTRQSQVGAAVSIIASAVTLPCISFVEKITGSPTLGYFLVTFVFSCCFLVCNIFFIKLAAPFDPPAPPTTAAKSASLKDMIEAIITNKQMFILVLTYTLFGIGSQINAGVVAYYFRVTGTFGQYALVQTIRSIVAFGASVVIPPIGKKIGKKASLVAGRFLWSAGALFIYFFALKGDGSANLIPMTIGMCLLRGATYTYMPFGVNYWLDCAEYGYYTTGKDMRGFAAAIMNIPTKIGMAIAGVATGYLVAWSGYVVPAGATVGYFEHMNRYMMVIGLIPAVIGILSGILTVLFYKLTDEEAAMYAKANAERDAAARA